MRAGFTLIELLVVIAIIGILAAGLIYLVNPLSQLQKSNDVKRKSDLNQLQKTLEAYYSDIGRYPAHSAGVGTDCSAVYYRVNPPTGCQDWDSTWTQYSTKLPKDPKSPTRTYTYWASTDGQSYAIYASLERTTDPQVCGGTSSTCSVTNINNRVVAVTACGATVACNYGVSSANISP